MSLNTVPSTCYPEDGRPRSITTGGGAVCEHGNEPFLVTQKARNLLAKWVAIIL